MSFFEESSKFSRLMASDVFVVSAELTPPRHYDLTDFMRKAEIISQYVDYVQLNDHLLSKARINNIIPGQQCKLADIEVVLQFALRHKNRIALQGDLLAMAASGLKNLIVLGGHPCSIGAEPEAIDVLDLNAIEALEKINRLTNEGQLFNGEVISPPPTFNIGTIEFPCGGSDLSAGMDRLERKIDAGAKFVQIQAIFELAPLNCWMEAVEKRDLHKRAKFLGAIFPFENLNRLQSLSQIPGLNIPESLFKRIKSNGSRIESLSVMKELVNGIRSIKSISGIHIRSIGVEEWVPEVVDFCSLKEDMIY